MNKKKRTTTLIIAGLVCVLLVVGIILTNTGEPKPETVKEVMKDAVVHDSNKINFFGIEVNPSVISAYTVTCIILVFALILRLFVIPKFKKIPGKLQSLLEMWVGFFDNLAKTSAASGEDETAECDVLVIGVGASGSVAALKAAESGAKVIGVDVDQAAIIDGKYGEGMTVTSAMKGLAATVNTELAAVLDGSFEGGKVENLGLIGTDPELNYVQLAGSTQFADGFTAEDYAALVADMYNGVITVNNDTSIAAADNATTITVNDLGNLK